MQGGQEDFFPSPCSVDFTETDKVLKKMIALTRLNGEMFYANDERIETIEIHPDSMLIFESGRKIIAKETPEEIIQKIIDFKEKINDPRARTTVFSEKTEVLD